MLKINEQERPQITEIQCFMINELSDDFGAKIINISWDASDGFFIISRCRDGLGEIKLDPSELRQLGQELIAAADTFDNKSGPD